jgi:RNA polymerase sigma-70 factor (ECF subfamily)
MLMRQGTDPETAEDIVQDTMLKVWCKSHLFSAEKGAISTWIYRIARNLRIDRLRRQIVWDDYRGELESLQNVEGQSEELNVQEFRLQVEQALSRLSAEQLEVVQLSFLDGLTQNEIAKKLGIPLGTVKSRMRLAYGKLRCATERDV